MNAHSLASRRSLLPGTPEAWKRWSLARRFIIMALCLSAVGTVFLGTWVSEKIEQTARARDAASAGIYVAHLVSPLVQSLQNHDSLSESRIEALDRIVQTPALKLRVVSMKVWNRNGTIVYSTNKDAIGEVYPIEGALKGALAGVTTSDFSGPEEESLREFERHPTLLEIYTPILSRRTGDIIAVAEFYEDAASLAKDLGSAQMQGWLVTGVVLASIIAGLYTLISDGSHTIRRQRDELAARITQLSEAMEKTAVLQDKLERGSREVIEGNERLMRTIGSELHDGPAQLISLAQLKLDQLDDVAPASDLESIRSALNGAIQDIRRISAGLLMPNVDDQDLLDCLKTTIRGHETKTQSRVVFHHKHLPKRTQPYVTICLCRFVQEGLANAARHANASGQTVTVEGLGDAIRIQISDTGPGISEAQSAEFGAHLGLISLRRRLESIRGTMTVSSTKGEGTTLTAWIPFGGE
ncbi:sensor histidine kinase [Hoeflea ulvae]|uniref:histidine kinase n=1 Tax=Hoeflea ulvae TaxID=2983764 RepID=A0ABT3YME0_9HYPH|nr:ATP-binding protein [Hoeflea ulvae]MCY0097074.1 ATP-binding protein [Hoeflea ulvae]